MIKPYYEQGGITIYHANCLHVLAQLPRVALVLGDPPYGAKERTDRASKGRGKRLTTRQSIKRQLLLDSRDYEPVIGDDQPYDPAPMLALKVPTILWGANYYADKLPPSRCWLTWDKREGGTSDDNADCELAWTNFDMPARLYSHLWRGVCRASEVGAAPIHPTQKPVALMRWCLKLARLKPGAVVFDPYMGSGPVAKACKQLGYQYIGCELVQSYCTATILGLQQETLFTEASLAEPDLAEQGAIDWPIDEVTT